MLDNFVGKLSAEIIFAALSILVAWFIYRQQRLDERKRILASITALLKMIGKWFGSEYDKNYENVDWYSPNFSVFPVDISQVPNILTSNLLRTEMSTYLSYLIQLIKRFNYRIEVVDQYRGANPDVLQVALIYHQNNLKGLPLNQAIIKIHDISDEKLKFYFEHLYLLQKQIHESGIGKGDLDNDIPSLSKCYRKIECLLEVENIETVGIMGGKWYWVLSDIIFILIPVIITLLYIVNKINIYL